MVSIRQSKMKDFIEQRKQVTISEIQQLLPDVSVMTIHRDLNAMEAAGLIVKYRGGARSVLHVDDPEFNVRIRENMSGKLLAARKALELIQPHTAVFLDAGTTNLALAQCLPDINLNIFTTGPGIALELCRLHKPVVTLCGGMINRNNLAVSGRNTLEILEKINIDLAFVGVSGCSVDAGFTCGTESDMLVKRMVIQKARTTVMMCTQEKFRCLMPYTFASLEDVDYVVSDAPVPDGFRRAAEAASVMLL